MLRERRRLLQSASPTSLRELRGLRSRDSESRLQIPQSTPSLVRYGIKRASARVAGKGEETVVSQPTLTILRTKKTRTRRRKRVSEYKADYDPTSIGTKPQAVSRGVLLLSWKLDSRKELSEYRVQSTGCMK